jgi:hypothetical protein
MTRSPFLILAQLSLAVSSLSAVTWILLNPSDPPDDPRLWVGVLTFLWHFLVCPAVYLITVVGAIAQRRKHPARRTVGVATLALLLPTIGQLLAYAVWGTRRGLLG